MTHEFEELHLVGDLPKASQQEQDWLVTELKKFLQKVRNIENGVA